MELIELSRLTQNEDNPRYITEDDFRTLLVSIATFPQMLFGIRPIIIDEAVNVLGGNMRLLALQRIAEMPEGELRSLINSREDKTEGEREALMQFWADWRKEPTAPILRSEDLTEEQKLECIAKDNINNGSWDSAKLAAKWDMGQLKSWGIAQWVIGDMDTSAPSEDNTEEGERTNSYDSYVVKTEIVFDDEAQQQEYYALLVKIKKVCEGETTAARLVAALKMWEEAYGRG